MVLINGYPIDCTRMQEHSLEADVTFEPVESGSQITDHVQVQPVRLVLEGWVSDTPIGAMVAKRQEFALIEGEAFVLPSDEAYAFLRQIHEKREPVPVDTELRRYENMVLRSLSVPIDAQTGDALMFRAEFVQVRIVENERTTVRVAVPRGSAKKNLGHKAASVKGDPPPAYLLRDQEPTRENPRFVGANSGGRRLINTSARTSIASGGGGSRVPIASGGG